MSRLAAMAASCQNTLGWMERNKWWLVSLLAAAVLGVFYDWTGRDEFSVAYCAAFLVILALKDKAK